MVNVSKSAHPLLVRGPQITEKMYTWTLHEHPHAVVGTRRGFAVRVYHYPADGFLPYLVVELVQDSGWVMHMDFAPTASAAHAFALERLSDLAGNPSSSSTEH